MGECINHVICTLEFFHFPKAIIHRVIFIFIETRAILYYLPIQAFWWRLCFCLAGIPTFPCWLLPWRSWFQIADRLSILAMSACWWWRIWFYVLKFKENNINVEMSSLGRLHPFLCKSLSGLTENLSREINWESNGKKNSLGHSSFHYLRCCFFSGLIPPRVLLPVQLLRWQKDRETNYFLGSVGLWSGWSCYCFDRVTESSFSFLFL